MMLRCKDVAEVASDYVNRDLSLVKRLQVWWHLRMCVVCTRYVQQIRHAVAVLRQVGRDAPGSTEDAARSLFRSAQKE
jgi:hypothetical protein